MSRRITCPVCGHSETRTLFEKQGSTFVQCIYDGLVYIDPQPSSEELQQIYDGYGEEWYVLPESISTRQDFAAYRRRFLKFRQTNRLLEIGAAAGGFLIYCQNDGWLTFGVELSAPSSRLAREQHGLDVITGTIHDAAYPDDFFDVVTSWQTLEHVPDPREVITEIFRTLRSGGFFVWSVPRWNGLSIRLIKEKCHLVSRDHLFYFDHHNISRMLTDIGFSEVRTKTRGFNPVLLYRDLRGTTKRFEEQFKSKGKAAGGETRHGYKSRLSKVLRESVAAIIGILNIGDCLFVEAIK